MTQHDTKNTIFDTNQHNTDTTKTHEKPPNKKRRPHINFHQFASKKCQTPHPPKITILLPVYIKEYQCTNMYIKKNNIYMNYIFIISSINTHTPIYKKIIYNYSYKMLIKKNKNPQPHTPQGGVWQRQTHHKKQQYTTTPKTPQTTHRPIRTVLYYPRDFIKNF